MMRICKHRVMDKCKKTHQPCNFGEDCFEPEEYKTFTNADKIRAMDDETLASQLVQVFAEGVLALADIPLPYEILNEVRSEFLKKLKEPVEDE